MTSGNPLLADARDNRSPAPICCSDNHRENRPMSLFDWLFGRTRKADEPPRMPPRIAHVPPAPAPRADEAEEEIPVVLSRTTLEKMGKAPEIVPVDPAVFAMDYTDANGNKSRRRVKLLGVTNHTTPAWINAICYERQKIRTFRVDRIAHIISLNDGEAHDPVTYLTTIAGIPPEMFGLPDDPVLAHARRIFDKMRAPLSVLVLAALEDGVMHPKEIDAIMDYARKELTFLVRDGWARRGDKRKEMVIIRDMVVTLRPDRNDLRAYVKTMREWESDRRIEHLTDALMKVVQADGDLSRKEISFLKLFNAYGTD